MTYNDIITLLCPSGVPVEEGYLWAKFEVTAVPGCRYVFYCANASIAAQLLVNQIKPTIKPGEGYFAVFPVSDAVDINGTESVISASFTVTHFGWYDNYQSEAIARTHVTKLLEYYRAAQQRYISSIRVNNTTFSEWADDNSVIQQYTSVVTVRAVEPYALASDCYDTNS
jgi:hypothetical protein